MGLVNSLASTTIQNEVRPGIHYQHHADLILHGDTYIVPVILDVRRIFAPLNKTKHLTDLILQNLKVVKQKYLYTDILKEDIQELSEKSNSLQFLMDDYLKQFLKNDINNKPKRNRRGAINFIGSIAHSLFGVATDDQINTLNDKLHNLDSLTEKERRLLNIHSQILNVTLHDLLKVQQSVNKLQIFTIVTKDIIRKLEDKLLETEHHLMLLQTLMHVHLALNTISVNHVNLKIGIQELMEGTVSSHIITNEKLMSLLHDVSINTNELLFPLRPEFLRLHRTAIKVVYERDTINQLTFYFLIPLKNDIHETFHVFHMTSLPYKVNDTNSFISHVPSHKYFVISQTRRTYFMTNDFPLCSQYNALLICPPNSPLYSTTVDSCELSLFLQRYTATKLCKKYVLHKYPPIFIKDINGWSYSTSEPIHITSSCPNSSISRYTIENIGTLKTGQHCKLSTDNFFLPSSSSKYQNQPLEIQPYHYSLPLTYTPWEQEFLKNASNMSLPSSGDGLQPIPLQQYVQSLQPLMKPAEMSDAYVPDWLALALLLGILLAMVGILGCRRVRTWYADRTFQGPSSHTLPSSPELHELQPLQARHDDETDPVPNTTKPLCTHKAQGRATSKGGALLYPALT